MPLDSGSILAGLPRSAHYLVAYSGGVDSHVLLALLASVREQLDGELVAVHVDHGIQQSSAHWAGHCRQVCEQLGVAFRLLRVNGRARTGESPEAAARSARYRGLIEILPKGAILLTAQHQDDQAETLLLQLIRGAGARGLASMPYSMPFGAGQLVRPFLRFSRKQILAWATRHQLHWMEDPSNADVRYDRNFIRHRLLPELLQRWPSVTTTLARAASHQADQLELAGIVAQMDFQRCRSTSPLRLMVDETSALSLARQRNLLRYWIESGGFPLPSSSVLRRISEEILGSREDAVALVHWPGTEVRRYRNHLYLMKPLPQQDPGQQFDWQSGSALTLSAAGGELTVSATHGQGLRPLDARIGIRIRFRQGGERLQPAGRVQHHRLKSLMQQWGVPPWERSRVPLVYIDDKLAAVAGLCVAEGFQADSGSTGWTLHWSRSRYW